MYGEENNTLVTITMKIAVTILVMIIILVSWDHPKSVWLGKKLREAETWAATQNWPSPPVLLVSFQKGKG